MALVSVHPWDIQGAASVGWTTAFVAAERPFSRAMRAPDIAEPSLSEAVEAIADQLFQLVDEKGCRQLVLNLANVEALESAMIGKILILNHKLLALGGRLKLCRVPPPITEILVAARLPKILGIYEDEGQALSSF